MDSLRDRQMREAGAGADGFLGVRFLHDASAILDLQNLRLYLRPPKSGRGVNLGPALKAAGLSAAPFVRAQTGACLVDVGINGVTKKMIIDTGAYLTSVDTRFAAQANVAGYQSNIEMMDIAGVQKRANWSTPKNFAVGGIPVHPPKIVIADMSFYTASHGLVGGLLGLDFLGQNWSIVDFGSDKLYFSAIR
jgi:hypothetical protein